MVVAIDNKAKGKETLRNMDRPKNELFKEELPKRHNKSESQRLSKKASKQIEDYEDLLC